LGLIQCRHLTRMRQRAQRIDHRLARHALSHDPGVKVLSTLEAFERTQGCHSLALSVLVGHLTGLPWQKPASTRGLTGCKATLIELVQAPLASARLRLPALPPAYKMLPFLLPSGGAEAKACDDGSVHAGRAGTCGSIGG
jgi:hypothetical protein